MNYLLLEYPKCSTCQKAKKWLEENEIPFEDRHIVEQNPTAEELRQWTRAAGFPLKKLFNTSGLLYRSMGLKEKLPQLTEDCLLYTSRIRPLLYTPVGPRFGP